MYSKSNFYPKLSRDLNEMEFQEKVESVGKKKEKIRDRMITQKYNQIPQSKF